MMNFLFQIFDGSPEKKMVWIAWETVDPLSSNDFLDQSGRTRLRRTNIPGIVGRK